MGKSRKESLHEKHDFGFNVYQNYNVCDDDKIKSILQLLAKIEYEYYLEIKEKMTAPLIVRNECRILPMAAVNCSYFYKVA